MIEEFVSRTFATRNAAHIEHFRTQSYAAHMALGDFYESLIDAVDTVVEAYQGSFELIGEVPAPESFDFTVSHLKDEADWIEINRKEIAGDSDAVANLVDAVTAVYLKAIYKLENLR